MSLTTLLPPVYDHADGGTGRLLVDGAYCDNLPVRVMRDEYGARVVIGVDVENKDHSAFDDIAPWDYLSGYPGYRVLARRARNALAAALGVERAAGWRSPNFSAIATTLQFITCTAQLREAVHSRSLDLHVVVQSSQKCGARTHSPSSPLSLWLFLQPRI